MKAYSGLLKIIVVPVMLVFILLQPSCNIKNHIRKDKYLVNKVKVKGEPNGMNDALYNLSKQKPNARLLGVVRYNMWMYLLFENKVDAFFKRDQKIKELSDEIKKERLELATNQNTLTDKQKAKLSKKISKLETKLEDAITNNDEIKAAVDAPVLLDSSLLIESATQMKYYLKDKGYFRDSVKFKVYTHRQKASVVYECFPGPMYYINKYEVAPGDSIIASIIKADTGNYKIKKGKAYSKDLLEDEKTRIFNLLSDRGYYKLKLSNIHYDGDTFIKGDSVSVKMNFEHLEVNSGNRIYKVKNVFIEPEYSLGDTSLKDSLKYKGYIFLSKDPSVKPQVIYDFIYIKPNSLFNDDDKKSTINRLFQLNAYRYIDISYLEDFTATGDTGIINCYIKMTLAKKYLYTGNIELNRTEEADPALTNNYNTLYGISATTGILDRNLAKRALQFQTQLRLAVEVPFDTVHFFRPVPNLLNYQFGLNNSLIFPKLLYYPHWLPIFNLLNRDSKLPALTSFNLNFLFEHNGYFTRTTANTNLTWQVTNINNRYYITPIEVSLINAKPSSLFVVPNDPLIKNLFDQHVITDFRYMFTHNLQPIGNVISKTWFLRLGAEVGGMLPYVLDPNKKSSTDQTSQLLGIKYFTYTKFDADIRGYWPVFRINTFAARFAVGAGFPFAKSTILPFEKRYYIGGANSVRAWRIRDLGPGSFRNNSDTIYDKSGDFKIEGSFELRFPIYSFIRGAVFTDYGNVWLDKSDPLRPGATFAFSTAVSELAVGSGIGLRFDFSFFVFRFDLAVPIRDPSYAAKDRWQYQNYTSLPNIADKMNLNIGIGYPF